MELRIIGAGPDSEFIRTLNKYGDQKARLKKQVAAFIEWKNKYPFNGYLHGQYPGFGNSDSKFRSTGNFTSKIPGLAHAHLTPDLSIVYFVDRETGTIRLYGIYSHDAIGTGQPANPNKQQQMASRWANMSFDASIAPALDAETDTASTAPAPAGTKPNYAPKAKAAVPVAAPKEKDPFFGFVKMVDAAWPERNLFRQMQATKDIYEKISLINKEAQYLALVKQRNRLYPNQVEYFKGLEGLLNYIKAQQKR